MSDHTDIGGGDVRSEKIYSAIKTLLRPLPLGVQERILTELLAELCPISPPRAGVLLRTIVRLLARQENWKVDDLKKRIAEAGVSASAKEVYNALGYLTRKGHIERVGYGLYKVA